MFSRLFAGALALAAGLAVCSAPACAQGDLLVAPTRLVLSGASGGEVIVSNAGTATTTYRISLVIKRMDASGQIHAVPDGQALPAETAAVEMINHAPRRITLAPQQSQTIRIGVRPPPDLAPGEYRAHLLFRAVPDAPEVAAEAPPPGGDTGMAIRLTPIYGVAIPVIVRIGAVDGAAQLVSARLQPGADPAITVDLARSGGRSVYGTLDVLAPGHKEPVATIKGVSAYPEIAGRQVRIPVPRERLAGVAGLVVRFTETDPAGRGATSEVAVK